jgi:hypothetical protein
MGVAAAIRAARVREATPHILDGTVTESSAAMLAEIARVLEFPEDFGHNLDALYDMLTDLSWLSAGEHVLIWSKPSVLRQSDPTGYDAVGSVLSDAVTDGQANGVVLSVLMLTD